MCDGVTMSNIGNAPGDLFWQTITTIVTTTAVIPTTTNQPTNQPTATTTTTTTTAAPPPITKKNGIDVFTLCFYGFFLHFPVYFFAAYFFVFFLFSSWFSISHSVFMNHQSKLAVEFKAETTFHFRVRLQKQWFTLVFFGHTSQMCFSYRSRVPDFGTHPVFFVLFLLAFECT